MHNISLSQKARLQDKHRNAHLELLSLLERKAFRPELLTPLAFLVRVADHFILIAVRVKTRVNMQGEILFLGNIDCKTAQWEKNI